ncbi:MAG: DUF3987 domain-containing protein [Nitrospira sp.]|nr:DUF3987 domain-containing protein [Nitrospira sp.]
MTTEEQHAHEKRIEDAKRHAEAEQMKRHEQARERANKIWNGMQPAPIDHRYLKIKSVPANNLRLYRGDLCIAGCRMHYSLIMPIYDRDEIVSLQFIDELGGKFLLPGGRKKGCSFQIGEINEDTQAIGIGEGYATVATVRDATGLSVVSAIDAGNLRPVAEALRARFRNVQILIFGDNDQSGVGQKAAMEAAQAVGGIAVIPTTTGMDWNDIAVRQGVDVVKKQIEALHAERKDADADVIPLDAIALPDFPLEAFPDALRAMVEGVAHATETPVELAAMMGLGTVAGCCQRIFEVEVEDGYREPLNLWVVTLLESGNRKTAVQQALTEPLRDAERVLCEQSKTTILEAESKRATIEAKVKAIRTRIANSEHNGNFESEQTEINKLLAEMPDVPVTPRLWAQDITTEKLGVAMAENGERMAILSDEGGLFDILAGRYSNGIPNLDTFLQSHAGSAVRVDRGSRPSVMMHRPALTISLSPQPGVLRGLTGQSMFRDRGLLARFLYTIPPSRLGYRRLVTSPVPTGVREKYRDMVATLLKFTPTRDEHGDAIPMVVRLSPEAKREWLEFASTVEANMRPDGVYEHLKDWAGKMPGAAIRIAGLFHCMRHAESNPTNTGISRETMTSAITLMAVLGQHAIAAFDLMGSDPALEGAKRVWRWIEQGRRQQFTARQCFQAIRGSLPKMNELDAALKVLTERGFLQEEEVVKTGPGRRKRPFIVSKTLTEGWA